MDLACGWVSDRVFKGWRSGAGILFLAGVGLALLTYWLLPATAPIGVFYLLIAIIGGLIYGPVMLIGLQAIDLSPRSVAGTAAGFTGLFGYLLGASLASTGVGVLIDNYGWNVTYGFLVAVVGGRPRPPARTCEHGGHAVGQQRPAGDVVEVVPRHGRHGFDVPDVLGHQHQHHRDEQAQQADVEGRNLGTNKGLR